LGVVFVKSPLCYSVPSLCALRLFFNHSNTEGITAGAEANTARGAKYFLLKKKDHQDFVF